MARIALIIALIAFTAALAVGIPMVAFGITFPFTGAVIVAAFPTVLFLGTYAAHAAAAPAPTA